MEPHDSTGRDEPGLPDLPELPEQFDISLEETGLRVNLGLSLIHI